MKPNRSIYALEEIAARSSLREVEVHGLLRMLIDHDYIRGSVIESDGRWLFSIPEEQAFEDLLRELREATEKLRR